MVQLVGLLSLERSNRAKDMVVFPGSFVGGGTDSKLAPHSYGNFVHLKVRDRASVRNGPGIPLMNREL